MGQGKEEEISLIGLSVSCLLPFAQLVEADKLKVR